MGIIVYIYRILKATLSVTSIHRLAFFLSGPSSSSSLKSAYNVLGCVLLQACVNRGSSFALSAYFSSASLGSSSRILLKGTYSLTYDESGFDLANGVVAGTCGLRGSLDLPEAVRPTVGCLDAYDAPEGKAPPGVMMASPDRPAVVSVVRLGSSSICLRFGVFDMTNLAPPCDMSGLYKICVSAFAEPVMI